MTALKLHMPGVGERTGEEGGAGAGRAGAHAQQNQQRQNGIGGGAAAAGGQGRCRNSSGHAGFGSSIMQPFPLASRCAGAAKHGTLHSASSALGSNWIRRFLPSTSDVGSGELGQEATRVPRGGGDSGSQPIGPLLLAPAPKEHKELAVGMAEGRMAVDSGREPSAKVSGSGQYMDKGKAPEGRGSQHETTTADQDLGKNDIRSSHQKVTTLSSLPRTSVVEGSSRQQQHEGKHGGVLPTRGESHVNGTSGPIITGFGPLRVVMRPPKSDFVKGAGMSTQPRAPVMERETRVEADVPAAQPDVYRPSSATAPDRKPNDPLVMASQTGKKFNPLSKSTTLVDRRMGSESGGPSRAAGFAGAWGFPKSKKPEIESDGVRPGMVQSDGARETAMTFAGSKGGEPAVRHNAFGEAYYQKRPDPGYRKCLDPGSGVEGTQTGCNKFGERIVTPYPPASPGRKEDGGQATESRHHSRVAEDASARPTFGAGFPTGLESRKMKEVVGCGFSSKRFRDAGPSQQQHSEESPPYAPRQYQGDTCIGKVGHPLPFSPHSSFAGEENSGEDTGNSRGKAEPTKSRLTPLFSARKPYEDGLDGRAGQSERRTPWTSLFAAFKGQKQPEPPNSSSSTATLAPDVHSRLHDRSVPVNRPSEGPKASVNHEGNDGGERGSSEAGRSVSSGDARSRFDNQSSHFSSSPWPDNESHNPNDDTGSGPSNSQATGSGYHSQASRVANHAASDSKGQHRSTYRYDTGGAREVSHTPSKSRNVYTNGPSAGNPGKDGRKPQMLKEENQAHGSPTRLRHFTMQAMSGGQKDDTSGSSPPTCPLGYNSSDLGSPVLLRGVVEEQLRTIAGQSRTVEVDSDMEGNRVPRWQNGQGDATVGFEPRRLKGKVDLLKHGNGAAYRDHRDASALASKDLDSQKAQPTVRDMYHESRPGRSNGPGETGLKHGKLRMSGEAMGEGGTSGSSKRICHHPVLGSRDLASQAEGSGMPLKEQGNGVATRNPSSWLKRWLPPSNANIAKPASEFARPKDKSRNGLLFESPRGNGNNNFMGFSGDRSMQVKKGEAAVDERIEKGMGVKGWNGLKDMSRTRRVDSLPFYPTPSAAAMALVGTAARKMGPLPQQRKGSFAMWPSVHLEPVQPPEGQRSSQSSELPVYVNQS